MTNLLELVKAGKPVGKVSDTRNGTIMEFAIFLNEREDGGGYRFSAKFTNTYAVEEEQAGQQVTIWKEKKSFAGNDFLRLQKLSGQADELEQQLRRELKEELKAPVPAAPAP